MSRSILTSALTTFAGLLPDPRSRRPPPLEQPPPPIKRALQAIDYSVNRVSGISAALGDRWTIVGITRSGKTTFAKQLLAHIRATYPAARIYIIDSKWMGGDFEEYPGIVRSQEAPDPLHTPGGTLVWQTTHDDPAEYDRFIRSILKAGKPAFFYIDEIINLARGNSGLSYPPALSMLFRQGGGLGIGCAVATQECSGIPRAILNQTTHIVRFPLELTSEDYDARKIDKRLKRPRAEWGLDPAWYSFYYKRNQGLAKLHLFSDYRAFFTGGA